MSGFGGTDRDLTHHMITRRCQMRVASSRVTGSTQFIFSEATCAFSELQRIVKLEVEEYVVALWMTGFGTALAVYRGRIIDRGKYSWCAVLEAPVGEKKHRAVMHGMTHKLRLVPWDRNVDSLSRFSAILPQLYPPKQCD